MQLLGTVRQPLLTRKSNTICVLAGESLNAPAPARFIQMQIHTTVTITKTNYLLHLLTCGALFYILSSTKVVTAEHSTCKENHFEKLDGGPKHLKHICSVGKQIDDKRCSARAVRGVLVHMELDHFTHSYCRKGGQTDR